MTFARWFPIQGIDENFLVDYKTITRAYAVFALMAPLFLWFWRGITHFYILVCCHRWLYKPQCFFVVAAFDPDFWDKQF